MDDSTANRLNAINREFYAAVADEFDTTRGKAWQGWHALLPALRERAEKKAPYSVLDIGCGNGRFGVFLAKQLRADLVYHGIDNNAALLERARDALAPFPRLNATLNQQDIIEDGLPTGRYDLVVLFGVMHHVPGAARRLALMRSLAERVAPGGLLVFACWRFYEYERFRSRIVPFPADVQTEPGDYLLDWRRGANALRYCHYVDETEHAALIAATGLTPLDTYRADGRQGDANLYAVLEHP